MTGLAWTEVGGEILITEATLMPGRGRLTLTGKLGDVMQESAQAAMSFVRSRAEELGIPKDFNRKIDVHVHIPEAPSPRTARRQASPSPRRWCRPSPACPPAATSR
ncbi:MAG: S16 family serine protease [Vicinamibacterales bacterium]